MTTEILSDNDLDLIFREARSFKAWQDKPVSEITIRAVYDLQRWGPTNSNSSPARFVIVRSEDAREKLAACVDKVNRECMRTAPVCVIIGQDLKFSRYLPDLYEANHALKDKVEADPDFNRITALTNSSMQGAYMMVAARAIGLDCSPLASFDATAINEAFFPGGDVQVNFLCAMGYGDRAALQPRDKRFSFDEACRMV